MNNPENEVPVFKPRPRVPCPKCGSKRVVRICYGLPEPGTSRPDLGMVRGGCCIDEDSPVWFCHDCRKPFGRMDDEDEMRDYFGTEEDLSILPPN